MKQRILFGAVLLIALVTGFRVAPTSNANATVEQIEGIYIFVQSKPTEPNDYLGSIKRGGFLETPTEMLRGIIKKAKKQYPDVQGVIVDRDYEKADCVKFKQ